MIDIIIAFIIGVIIGFFSIVVICCLIGARENKPLKDKDDWREIP